MEKIIDGFKLSTLSPVIEIEGIFTVHYFEYPKNFSFKGERHNFWEFLYVDWGVVQVQTDDNTYLLKKDHIIFHKPNEWHTVEVNHGVETNLIVISFACDSPMMKYFENKVLLASEQNRQQLGQIIREAKKIYANSFSDPLTKEMEKKHNYKKDAEQVLKLNLELLLISLMRDKHKNQEPPSEEKNNHIQIEKLCTLLQESVYTTCSIDELVAKTALSPSAAYRLFKKAKGITPGAYLQGLRISEAKLLLRRGALTITQIASLLGYASIHHFSRAFKREVGLSPSDYTKSVKSLIDNSTSRD